MANRGRRRASKRVRRSTRPRRAALQAVLSLALDMEEPLRHAGHFVRAIELIDTNHDEEIAALVFVATRARLLLETVDELWNRLVDKVKAA